jgi:polysaccharide biosynthesis protein PslH
VITCSAADSQLLRERHGLQRLTPVPNAVRPPQPARATTADAHDLLFVGNLSYGPNVEAARWLCERVLPLLGEARLAIVGSDPAQQVLALASDPRVVVAPDVEDLAPWYENAAVAVVPVLRGGGSRIKLIEALAHRRPVVATSAGAAGLPWTDDESPVVIADAPEEFADACRALLEDRVRAAELAEAGEMLVRERASVEVVAGQIDRLVRSLVGA